MGESTNKDGQDNSSIDLPVSWKDELPFRNIRAKVTDKRKKLLEYYGGDEEVLDIAVKKDSKGEDTLAARMAHRVLTAFLSGNSPFVIASLGSSVTAGHDGFWDTAYPAVLERMLGDMMSEANLTLVVRNVAVGGRGPWLASLCVQPQAGDDGDIITREWEYWPFDAGLQEYGVEQVGADRQAAALELFLHTGSGSPISPWYTCYRWSRVMQKRLFRATIFSSKTKSLAPVS